MQGATKVALTKLDVLSDMEKIPVCVRYRIGGGETDEFPFPAELDEAEPVIEYVKGWQRDISGIRRWEDLPEEAKEYVTMVERAIGCPITYISVGAERESMIIR
jgi:adenylosuccinate synthase